MQRREALAILAGAVVAWPVSSGAQQKAMPVIGILSPASYDPFSTFVTAFRQGLSEAGYVEGENLAIEYRYAEGHYDRLPELAADLVGRKVDLIMANSPPAALAAKSATSTILIVFRGGSDPVATGLVASLARPAEAVQEQVMRLQLGKGARALARAVTEDACDRQPGIVVQDRLRHAAEKGEGGIMPVEKGLGPLGRVGFDEAGVRVR